MSELVCPFCKKKVEDEYESIHGCASCIDDWIENANVDHPI
jgi:hypothetical protein